MIILLLELALASASLYGLFRLVRNMWRSSDVEALMSDMEEEQELADAIEEFLEKHPEIGEQDREMINKFLEKR